MKTTTESSDHTIQQASTKTLVATALIYLFLFSGWLVLKDVF